VWPPAVAHGVARLTPVRRSFDAQAIDTPVKDSERDPPPLAQMSKPRSAPRRGLWFHAYETSGRMSLLPRPSRPTREWMDRAPDRFPYRCLPMLIANQWGWDIISPAPFACAWTGGPRVSDLAVEYPDAAADTSKLALSHFGMGILTIKVPYLLRTPPGYWTWVKGPANQWKDGIVPLEGIVETDWATSTFTANWKVTRSKTVIRFDAGDVLATLVPAPRAFVERFHAAVLPLAANAVLQRGFEAWSAGRSSFNGRLREPGSEEVRLGWQRDYLRGIDGSGKHAVAHRTRLDVAEFEVRR